MVGPAEITQAEYRYSGVRTADAGFNSYGFPLCGLVILEQDHRPRAVELHHHADLG